MPRKPNSEAQVTPEVEAVEAQKDTQEIVTEAPKAPEKKITVLPHGATVEDN